MGKYVLDHQGFFKFIPNIDIAHLYPISVVGIPPSDPQPFSLNVQEFAGFMREEKQFAKPLVRRGTQICRSQRVLLEWRNMSFI